MFSVVIILGCKRWASKIPGVLIAVVGSTLAVAIFDLTACANISVIGPLPQGLPMVRLPLVTVSDLQSLLSAAVAIQPQRQDRVDARISKNWRLTLVLNKQRHNTLSQCLY